MKVLRSAFIAMLLACELPAQKLQIGRLHLGDSVTHYHFEVEPSTGRARLALNYLWPDVPEESYGIDREFVLASHSPYLHIPGLRYDASASQVVYEQSGTRIVCAMVRPRGLLWKKWLAVTPTGACKLTTASQVERAQAQWGIQQRPAISLYFVTE